MGYAMAARLTIKPDNRIAFIGRTGSGKSYLARGLTLALPRLMVLDPKGMIKNNEWGLESYVSKRHDNLIKRGDAFRVRVPTPLDGDWERYLWLIYQAGGATVYIDEAYGVCLGSDPPPALTALVTRGREMGIGVWTATQRPSWIPLFLLSESEWYFVFRLKLEKDRKRMAEMLGPEVLTPIPDRHGFYAYNVDWDNAAYYRQATLTERG